MIAFRSLRAFFFFFSLVVASAAAVTNQEGLAFLAKKKAEPGVVALESGLLWVTNNARGKKNS